MQRFRPNYMFLYMFSEETFHGAKAQTAAATIPQDHSSGVRSPRWQDGLSRSGNFPLSVKHRYDETIARWLVGQTADPLGITVDELAIRYFEYARQHYRKNGDETSEVTSIRSALRLLVKAD